MTKPVTIAIVAGEASGDILGAGLIRALKQRLPHARFVGIGGPDMLAEGFESLFPMERLSVMGLVEVLGRLKELLHIRKTLVEHFCTEKPDVFIGIDAPDFNLPLEQKLHDAGIATVHYVSPSVWAWRQKRVLNIKQSTDHMLTLLPFEARFYEEHAIPVTFVGHPLADKIPLDIDVAGAREALGYDAEDQVVALMPGSRGGEVKRLGPVFLQAARLMLQQQPQLKFVIPCANAQRREQLEQYLADMSDMPVKLLDGQSHQAMAAADAILIASGTATLEAMLHKKPMVVSYRVAWLTYQILRRMVKSEWVSLPNLLAGKALVPEILQGAATPERLAQETLDAMENNARHQDQAEQYMAMHKMLRRNASEQAAEAVVGLVEKQGGRIRAAE
ncbi:lipid-A-disaccharide synthase [Kistimonas asteriae]|uniref:lipid-A-disaccharide synthase n=1 Tax=Kistimonas asteriae TaxID=517724 RepID=UPI001BA8F940|nr:lipid-A-disaccharide synthase [Kistimonas asteriae]